VEIVYALNFFLNPQSPANPDPRRSMVAGSGTGGPALGSGPVTQLDGVGFGSTSEYAVTEMTPWVGLGWELLVAKVPVNWESDVLRTVHSLFGHELSNLKDVEFRQSENVKIKPNFASLGKKFGKKTADVAKLIEAMKPEAVKENMKLGEFEIEKSDLILRQETKEGTIFSEGYVTLDLAEDKELKEERLLRELVREIQKARKEGKLMVEDRITLYLEDKSFLKKAEKEIMEEVGASKVEYSLEERKGRAEYKDLKCEFGFKKN